MCSRFGDAMYGWHNQHVVGRDIWLCIAPLTKHHQNAAMSCLKAALRIKLEIRALDCTY